MRLSPLYRRILFLPLLLACVFLCSAGPVWAADYKSLVKKANEQLLNDQFIEALATARDAVRANAKDYKGHYYVAMACMGMGRFDDAVAAVNRARELAPQNARPAVEKLAGAINAGRQETDRGKAAEAALAEGLAGKAARFYEEAWIAGQNNPELGLKAADLYANRLSQPVAAARVLRQVSSAAQGSPAADRAQAELAKLADTLRPLAESHVANAGKQQGTEALQSLQLAEEADPTYIKIYELRAQLAAKGESVEALQNAIKALAKREHAQPQVLAYLPRMAQWLQQPAFNEFMIDLLGRAQAGQVRQMAAQLAAEKLEAEKVAAVKIAAEKLAAEKSAAAKIAAEKLAAEKSAAAKIAAEKIADGFIKILGGCFSMGNTFIFARGDADEKPVHEVCVSDFSIGKFEVTQAQYQGVMGSNPSYFRNFGTDYPVENVSWDDVQVFISRLNSLTGRRYRLPTEAEWEYAARSGGKSEKYAGGDNIDAVAWYDGNSGSRTHPVGQKQPNSLGVYDMSGNVWEWVQDLYDAYPGSGSNSIKVSSGFYRVIRGGGWGHTAEGARAANRDWSANLGFNNQGFRLVAPVQ